MTYQSNLPAIKARLQQATDAGLLAAVEVPVAETKRRLLEGFTSGRFVTGEASEKVEATEVIEVNGHRAIRYGTDLLGNLFWEVGFLSVFTKKFERVEIWVPISLETRPQQLAAFKEAYARVMGAAP